MHRCNIWELVLVYTLQLATEVNIPYIPSYSLIHELAIYI